MNIRRTGIMLLILLSLSGCAAPEQEESTYIAESSDHKNDFGSGEEQDENEDYELKNIKMKPEEFTKVIDVNLNGAFYMTKAISALMIKQRSGSIISMSSVSGLKGNPAQVNYSASKAGLVGMTLSAAKELGRRGIRVNGIAPGFVETDMTAVLTDEQKSHAAQNISMQRLGQPQDIANTALYLASDLSTYVTGQIIAVDGGLIM